MKFYVSDEVLKKTTRCCNNTSCLSTGGGGSLSQCKIEKYFDENMLLVIVVKETEGITCHYKFTIGNGNKHICTCPTRYAIYKQNKF